MGGGKRYRGRLVVAALLAVFMAMGVLMMFFALAGIQTIEWCVEEGLPIPWQAWVMLAAVAVWCAIAANVPGRRLRDLARLLTRATEE